MDQGLVLVNRDQRHLRELIAINSLPYNKYLHRSLIMKSLLSLVDLRVEKQRSLHRGDFFHLCLIAGLLSHVLGSSKNAPTALSSNYSIKKYYKLDATFILFLHIYIYIF